MITKSFLIKTVKRILLGLGTLLILCLLLGILFHEDVEHWILEELDQYISEVQSGDLEIEDVELALFQHLPNITVRLKNMEYYEQKDSLRTKDQSPILYAENFYLAFEPWELVRNKNLKVTTVSIEEGVLDLVMYEDNKTNLERAFSGQKKHTLPIIGADTTVIKNPNPRTNGTVQKKNKSEAESKLLAIDLKEVQLENISLKYNNPSEHYSSQIELASLDGEIVLNAKGISCDLKTLFEITKSAKFPAISQQGPASLLLNLDFIDATEKIVVHEGELSFENLKVDLKGTYDHKNGNHIDMEFDASSNDIAFLSKLIQEDILHQNKSLIENADIVLNGSIKGTMEDNIPKIDVILGVKDLSMEGPAGMGKFKNVGFEGELHTGESADFSTAILALRNLRGELPGGFISGNLLVKNFKNPYVKSDLIGSLVLDGYDKIFQLSNIDSLIGKINFTSDFDGLLNLEKVHQMDSIGSWSLEMEGIEFNYIPSNKRISGFNGKISASSNEVIINHMSMAYDSSNIAIMGGVKNLYHFIFNKEQEIEADLEVKSSQIYTSHFVLNPNSTALINDRISDLEVEVKVTANDNDVFDSYFPTLNIALKHMSFELDKFPALSNLEGILIFSETETGFNVDVSKLYAELPVGSANMLGNVVIPRDLKTLDANAALIANNIPVEYALDLIKEMNDRDLLNAKHMSLNKMNLLSGNLELSGLIETVPFALQKAEITNGNIILRQPDSLIHEIDNLNLNIDEFYFLHYPGSSQISGIESLAGKLHIDSMKISDLIKTPIDMDFSAANKQFEMVFSTSRKRINQDRGSVFLDIAKTPPSFEFSYDLVDVSIASAIEDYTSEQLMEGTLNASLQFKGSGTNREEVSSNLKGTVNIRGDSLTLYGIDIDNLLRKYKRSQKFNLADVSAFVLAGPMGAAVTKGADFTSLITTDLKPEDRTYVSQAMANWSIANGLFKTEDVAFSTSANRLAFQGTLDFANDTIPGFTAYVLDKKGCSLMEQRLYGKMGDIKIGKLKIAKTLLGSVINLVNSLVGKNCEQVYYGEVSHPISKK